MAVAAMGWVSEDVKERAQELATKRDITLSALIRELLERELQAEEGARWARLAELSEIGGEYRATHAEYRAFVSGTHGPVGEAVVGILTTTDQLAQQMADALNATRLLSPLRTMALKLVELLPEEVKTGDVGALCAGIETLGRG